MSQQRGAGDSLATSHVLTQRHYDAAAVLLAQSHWFEMAGAVLLGTKWPDLDTELTACRLRSVTDAQEAARRLSLDNLGIAPDEIQAIMDALSDQTATVIPLEARR
jgi:hypothetical protein